MPIYEYQCQVCQFELEALQKLSDSPLVDCPECGAAALRKKVSAAAFRLKGGGWYETDFKTDGKKNLAGDKTSSQDGAGSGGESKASASAGSGDTSGSSNTSSTSSSNNSTVG